MKFTDYAESLPEMPKLVVLTRENGPSDPVDIPSEKWDEIKHFDIDLYKQTHSYNSAKFVTEM